MKKLSCLFGILAALLTNVMCAVVGYHYGHMAWGAEHAAYGAPPSTAFLLAIPYAVGIAVCVILAMVFRKKAKS